MGTSTNVGYVTCPLSEEGKGVRGVRLVECNITYDLFQIQRI